MKCLQITIGGTALAEGRDKIEGPDAPAEPINSGAEPSAVEDTDELMQIKRHSGGEEPAAVATEQPLPVKKRKKALRIREHGGGAGNRVVFDEDGVGVDTFAALAKDDSFGYIPPVPSVSPDTGND